MSDICRQGNPWVRGGTCHFCGADVDVTISGTRTNDNVPAGIMPRLGAGKKLFLLYKCKYVASQLSHQLLR